MWLMMILKVTKKQGFTLYLENIFLEKPQGGQIDPPAVKDQLISISKYFSTSCTDQVY